MPRTVRRRRRETGLQIDAAPVFAALGDATRLQIIGRLCRQGPQSISRLTGDAQISRQAITKHLQTLEGAGLVRSQRHGRERLWALRPRGLDDIQRYLEQISGQWDQALQRLQALVEDTTE